MRENRDIKVANRFLENVLKLKDFGNSDNLIFDSGGNKEEVSRRLIIATFHSRTVYLLFSSLEK